MKKKRDIYDVKTITLTLSLFILFKPVIPFIEYLAIYDYIKNELCVNKDKPILECNGTCYLMKELAKASESENSKDKKHIPVEANIVFYEEIKDLGLRAIFRPIKLKSPINYSDLIYSYLNTDSVFRPPIV